MPEIREIEKLSEPVAIWKTKCNIHEIMTTWINKKKCWRPGWPIIPLETSFLQLSTLVTPLCLQTRASSASPSITHAYVQFFLLLPSLETKRPRKRIRIDSLVTIQHREFLLGQSLQTTSPPRCIYLHSR